MICYVFTPKSRISIGNLCSKFFKFFLVVLGLKGSEVFKFLNVECIYYCYPLVHVATFSPFLQKFSMPRWVFQVLNSFMFIWIWASIIVIPGISPDSCCNVTPISVNVTPIAMLHPFLPRLFGYTDFWRAVQQLALLKVISLHQLSGSHCISCLIVA